MSNIKFENKRFLLPKNRVFYCFENNKCKLLIANKDFTKFRTFEQLVNASGFTDVEKIDFRDLFQKIQEIKLKYQIITNEYQKKDSEKNEHQFNKNLDKFLKQEKAEIKNLFQKANSYLKIINWKILDNCVVCKTKTSCKVLSSLQQESPLYFFNNKVLLQKGNKYSMNNASYFYSFKELEQYIEFLEDENNKKLLGKKIFLEENENTEKYLNF